MDGSHPAIKSGRVVFGDWWAAICLVGLFCAIFGEAVWNGAVMVFRDTAHYYYPLLRFVVGEWRQGRLPLWNPYDNLGSPLAADPTAFVFYPGLLLVMAGRSIGEGINLFILAHFALAAWGCYRLARAWDASVVGATLAAMTYAFGGIVLFQYCNLVYLVGASWLPITLWAWDRAVRVPRPAHTALAALSMALLVLGGDFHTAYHAVLLWVAYWPLARKPATSQPSQPVLLPEGHTAPKDSSPPLPMEVGAMGFADLPDPPDDFGLASGQKSARASKHPFFRRWLFVLTIALGLSACLWIPAFEFGLASDRQIRAVPRSVYEWLQAWIDDASAKGFAHASLPPARGLLGQTQPGTHHDAVFQFSVTPARWGEFFWPNFAGRLFSENHRWLSGFAAEDRIWTPSLYLGLIPALCALAAFRLCRGGSPWERWLSWVALVSLLASLGRFGIGYLVQWIQSVSQQDPGGELAIGPSFGGIYWLATVLLPGYVGFRYPAKCLVVTALAVSQLAAQVFHRQGMRHQRGVLWLSVLVGGTSVAVFGAIWFQRESVVQAFSDGRPDPAFGPLVASGCLQDLLWAFGQAGVIGLALAAGAIRYPGSLPVVAVVATAIDLAVANRWMVATLPEEELTSPPALTEILVAETSPGTSPAKAATIPPIFPRVYRTSEEVAPDWQDFSSPRRLVEMFAWQRDSLFSKCHLLAGVGSLSPGVSARLADWQFALWVASRPPQPKEVDTTLGRLLGRLTGLTQAPDQEAEAKGKTRVIPPGASFALVSEKDRAQNMIVVVGRESACVPSGLALWRKREPLPFAWFPETLVLKREVILKDPRQIWEHTAEILYPGGQTADLATTCTLELDAASFAQFAAMVEVSSADWAFGNWGGYWTRRVRHFVEQTRAWVRHAWQVVRQAVHGDGSTPSGPAPAQQPVTVHNASWMSATLQLLKAMPGAVTVRIENSRGGLLALAQQYYPGWQAVLEPADYPGQAAELPIWRANRVMQAVPVPPGNWVLRVEFRPASVYIGGVISLTTLLGLTIWLAWHARNLSQSARLSDELISTAVASKLGEGDFSRV